jgi:RNA polymerase sigma-70 factor (ECF subfamily)
MSGENWAIGETWRRMAPMVLTLAQRCLGSASEAEDIAQEVFYRVFRKIGKLEDPTSLRSYIYSFAVRVLKGELRRRRRRAWLSFGRSETLENVHSQPPEVDSRDTLRSFHSLLGRLPPDDRLMFVLRSMESMTVDEIANHMNTSRSSVKRALNRASTRLTRLLEAEPGFADLLERGEHAE